jgi:hypothetical protein
MALTARFVAGSAMTPEAVARVPTQQLAAAASELGFSALDIARFLAEVEEERMKTPAKDAAAVIAEEAVLTRLRAREPWRAAIENAAAERADVELQKQAEQRELFLALCKAHALSSDDVLALTYILYGDAASLKFYAHVLMRKSGMARITAHNYFVASQRPDADAFSHADGALLATLPLPLFPPVAEFAAQSATLLREYTIWLAQHGGTPVEGGAPQMPFASSLFAKAAHGIDSLHPTGAGMIPVLNQGGELVADTTTIEAHVLPRFEKLEKDVRKLAKSISAKSQPTCYTCGKVGHKATDCGRGRARGKGAPGEE